MSAHGVPFVSKAADAAMAALDSPLSDAHAIESALNSLAREAERHGAALAPHVVPSKHC